MCDIVSWKQRADAQVISNITFTGFHPNRDLPLYQSAADILLMPYSRSIMGSSGTADSASVASPMKMFEYMAAGRAIVTSDLPVIREVLNEKNAVFCEPDDVGDWRLEIEKLLADEPRRIQLGEQAQQAVTGYTWLARAEKILSSFLRVSLTVKNFFSVIFLKQHPVFSIHKALPAEDTAELLPSNHF